MAKQLQLIHDEFLERKQTIKEIKREYRDFLSNDEKYQETKLKLDGIRETKKSIEIGAQGLMGKRWEELEEAKGEVEAMKETMTDVALTNLMDGKTVAVKDSQDNEYEPVWSVKFKKIQ